MKKMANNIIFHNARVTLNLSVDYVLIAGFICLHRNIASGPYTYFFICWLIGIKQFSIGESLLHEASHGLLFYPKRLNKISSILVAYPFFQTIDSYRRGHAKHHRLLGKDEDPLLLRHRELEKQDSFRSQWFFKPLFGIFLFNNVKKKMQRLTQKEFQPVLIFWVAVILLFLSQELLVELLIYWLVPLFWCQSTLVHWSELTDHYMTRVPSRSVNSWVYNFLIAHNGGYHAAHHFRPNVPFYQLPKLQKQESDKIVTEWTTGFWDTYKTIHQRHREATAAK